MDVSYSQKKRLFCGECNITFDEEIWFIFDIQERQDLLQRIKEEVLIEANYNPINNHFIHRDIS